MVDQCVAVRLDKICCGQHFSMHVASGFRLEALLRGASADQAAVEQQRLLGLLVLGDAATTPLRADYEANPRQRVAVEPARAAGGGPGPAACCDAGGGAASNLGEAPCWGLGAGLVLERLPSPKFSDRLW
jgi:hypothetical protein